MIEKILDRLDGVRKSGKGYLAKCPAHDDKNPSLGIQELSDGRIRIKCFSGCGGVEVLHAIGLDLRDLYPDGRLGEYRSFQRIEDEVKAKQKDKYFKDEIILQLAKADRENGKRLSPKDLEIERQAFMRIRARQQNANIN